MPTMKEAMLDQFQRYGRDRPLTPGNMIILLWPIFPYQDEAVVECFNDLTTGPDAWEYFEIKDVNGVPHARYREALGG